LQNTNGKFCPQIVRAVELSFMKMQSVGQTETHEPQPMQLSDG